MHTFAVAENNESFFKILKLTQTQHVCVDVTIFMCVCVCVNRFDLDLCEIFRSQL